MNGASVCSTKTTIAPSLSTASPLSCKSATTEASMRVVKALAELNVESDAQAVVEGLERTAGSAA